MIQFKDWCLSSRKANCFSHWGPSHALTAGLGFDTRFLLSLQRVLKHNRFIHCHFIMTMMSRKNTHPSPGGHRSVLSTCVWAGFPPGLRFPPTSQQRGGGDTGVSDLSQNKSASVRRCSLRGKGVPCRRGPARHPARKHRGLVFIKFS